LIESLEFLAAISKQNNAGIMRWTDEHSEDVATRAATRSATITVGSQYPGISNLAALATTTVQSSGVPQLQARMAASGALLRIWLFWAMLGCGICISANNPPSFGLNNLFNKITAPTTSEKDRDQLYEAYNMLHTLAQDFNKPFDAPAVIVVGHQTSGKSALIEALMGFQFNQVGPSRVSSTLVV
jgi:hypothetical protein